MDRRSPYAAVDTIIEDWCCEHELKLVTEFGGKERRFSYITGGLQECFQVSIEPPADSKVVINAWSIETIDDAELHESWIVEVSELGSALGLVWKQVGTWNSRIKAPATWFPSKSWDEPA